MFNSNIDHYYAKYPKELYNTNSSDIIIKSTNIGFIILRNVDIYNNNKYWIACYDSIRQFYPENTIIIYDISNNKNIIMEKKLINTQIIYCTNNTKSIFNAYLYYLDNKLFDKAVILKDKVCLTKQIVFNNNDSFLWQFEHKWDDVTTEMQLIKELDNNTELIDLYNDKESWKGCFESMSFISHELLAKINSRYNIYKLLNLINNNSLNSAFERVFALMFIIQNNKYTVPICGDIHWTTLCPISYSNYLLNKHNDLYWPYPMTTICS
jgi:hypothetical protein